MVIVDFVIVFGDGLLDCVVLWFDGWVVIVCVGWCLWWCEFLFFE